MALDLNINRSRVYEGAVQVLAAKALSGTDRKLFPTIRELLCFAALLGFSEGRRVPLDRSQGVEDVSYQQFERGNSEDLIWLIALADAQNVDVLRDGEEKTCAKIFEEYANGGLAIINDCLLREGMEHPDRALMSLLREKKYLVPSIPEPDLSGVAF